MPSPQIPWYPAHSSPSRMPCSAQALPRSLLLITVKEACSRRGPVTPRSCASVSQGRGSPGPDSWSKVGWTGPAVCQWNTATTPVTPCCTTKVGTVGCPERDASASNPHPASELHDAHFNGAVVMLLVLHVCWATPIYWQPACDLYTHLDSIITCYIFISYHFLQCYMQITW